MGLDCPCYISFEPGGTFSSLNEAKKMLKATADSGADAVKFQTFLPGDAERMMGNKSIKVNFKTSSGQKSELVFDALKRRELSKDDWKDLVEYAKSLNIGFISAGYFPETIQFLTEIETDAIKVSKGDINNSLLIDAISKTNLPVILDAREKFEDVEKAIKICEENNNHKIIIMHCPSGYPAENSGVHLNALKSIIEKHPCPVGFSDHSPGDLMNYAAVSLGTDMIEKTITLDKTIEQVEHFMSLELNDLQKLVKNIRSIEEAMGDSKILNTSRVEETSRRSLVAKSTIQKGDLLSTTNIDYKRPGNSGISCSEGLNLLGKRAKQNIPKDTFLQYDMIE